MSETEVHMGKLMPINLSGDLEQRAEKACQMFGYRKEDWHSSWVECIYESSYMEIIIHNDVIYRIHDKELDEFGFEEATRNEDGTVDYFLSYYNGGASFDEALKSALDKV